MSTDKVKDHVQRRQALDPAQSFIVQAPAGSGKTELLIQRYLCLLGKVEYPEEIIAITFTRKAAAGMQGRVVNALERVRNNIPPEDDVTRITDELAWTVLAQEQKYNWQLQNNPGRLRIQTIDSLCAWLTRQMPVLSKFGSQPEILDDAAGMYREAAANTLSILESGESWSDDIATLLSHLDNDLPKTRNMLASMLAKRDQWLRHVANDVRRDDLESALRHIVEATLGIVRQTFPCEHSEKFLECLRFAAMHIPPEKMDSPIALCRDLTQLPGSTISDLPLWQAIADICLTGNDEWRKRVDKNLGFPAGNQHKQIKDQIHDLLGYYSGNADLLQQLVEIRYLPPVHYSENEWQVVSALCHLLKLADAQLQVLFGERNQIDFTGIARAAIATLGNDETPTDLALHLDYRIKHLLVDEFQDVSVNQYDLLQKLVAGWSPGDGHSLFLVGDPMQSIYRFREAEIGLFLTTWELRRLGQVPLIPLNITVNFRSQENIVRWVNKTFSKVLPKIPDSARGAVSYANADAYHAEQKDKGVTIHAFINRDDTLEAGQVIKIIQAIRLNNIHHNVAVLVRNRSHLYNILPALKTAGLSFRAVEIETLRERPVIQDLLALTRALNHFADRIAWLAILRAPWCGLELADLLVLAGNAREKTIWECMHDETTVAKLCPRGRQALLKVRAVLEIYFVKQCRRSLRRAVESVWISLGGPATLDDVTDLENVQAYFELLEQFDCGGELRSRDQFMDNMEKLFAAPDVHADETFQIMTIHKAKGLEFDFVVLPGLGRSSARDEAQLLVWSENPHGMHQDLLLAPIREAGQDEAPVYDFVRRLEQEKQDYEQGRLLYVAATRAKQQLFLLGSVSLNQKGELNRPRSGSLLAQLWPVVETEFQQAYERYQPLEKQPEAESNAGNRLRRLTSDWTQPAVPEAVPWKQQYDQEELSESLPEYEWAGETIKQIGTVVHQYIQLIAEEGLETWNPEYIKSRHNCYELSLKCQGVPEKDIYWASDSVLQALLQLNADDRGQWILSPLHTNQQNEYALSGLYQNRIVNIKIDRTFIDKNGIRWVIDYKTSRHKGTDIESFLDHEQERYRQQLEKYGTLIKGIDKRPVKLGLYFPLLKGWREMEL